MVNGLCEGMVCVKGWFVWRDVWLSSLCGWFVWRDGLQKIRCNTVHTNQLSFSVLHIIWLVWRDGLCDIPSHKPLIILSITSLHTNHPFTQNIPSHNPFTIFYITYYLVCMTIWIVCITSIDTNHPFPQNIYHSLDYILTGLCDCLVYVNKLFVWSDGLCEGM